MEHVNAQMKEAQCTVMPGEEEIRKIKEALSLISAS
jgi:hypothetical protein